MSLDLLEGVRTLQWSGLHSSHASGITDTLNEVTDSDDCVGEVAERIEDNVAALVAALQPVEAVAPETAGRYYTW
jgi:hypothetical protein